MIFDDQILVSRVCRRINHSETLSRAIHFYAADPVGLIWQGGLLRDHANPSGGNCPVLSGP